MQGRQKGVPNDRVCVCNSLVTWVTRVGRVGNIMTVHDVAAKRIATITTMMAFSLGVSLRLFCCRISSLVMRRKAKRARIRLIRVGGPRLLNPDQRGLHNVVGASTSGLLSLVTGTCRSVGSLLRLRLTSASRQRAGVGAAPRSAHAVSLVEALRWHGSSERLAARAAASAP